MSKVREIREEREVSQETVANVLNITKAAYSRKENGSRRFTLVEAASLSKFFGVPIEVLFSESDVSEKESVSVS